MAKKKLSVNDEELDDDGNPLKPKSDDSAEDEDGEKPSKKNKSEDGDEDENAEEENDEDEEEEDDLDPDEVPLRKSIVHQQQIIARKNSTIKKLKSKVEDDEEDGGEGDDVDDESDEDVIREAESLVQREVKKAITPLVKTITARVDEDELKDLLRQEPEAKKYEKRIRTYMGHPNYAGVPATVIFHHLAFNASQTATTKKKEIADDEADEFKNPGRGGQRPNVKIKGSLPSLEDLKGMDDEEFDKIKAKSLRGKFLRKEEL